MGGKAAKIEPERLLKEITYAQACHIQEYLWEQVKIVSHIVGSLRREIETVGDIDLVIVSDAESVWEQAITVVENEGYKKISGGSEKATFFREANERFPRAHQLDLYRARRDEFGAQMLTWTGSKEFNIRCRAAAKRKGMKLSQHGLFLGERRIAAESEEDILNVIGMSDFLDPKTRR